MTVWRNRKKSQQDLERFEKIEGDRQHGEGNNSESIIMILINKEMERKEMTGNKNKNKSSLSKQEIASQVKQMSDELTNTITIT